jgi:hypothetical protein
VLSVRTWPFQWAIDFDATVFTALLLIAAVA